MLWNKNQEEGKKEEEKVRRAFTNTIRLKLNVFFLL